MVQRRAGFSLIELLVVIAIIAVLAAILFPVFFQAKRSALMGKCSSNIRQIQQAWLRYVDDHNGRTAPAYRLSPWQALLPWPFYKPFRMGILSPYLNKSEYIAYCPEYQQLDPRHPFANRQYGYNMDYLVMAGTTGFRRDADVLSVSLVTFSMIQVPSRTICFIDAYGDYGPPPKSGVSAWTIPISARHNKGWNVSFCDGHVKWYPCRGTVTAGGGWIGEDPISKDDYLWALSKANYRR